MVKLQQIRVAASDAAMETASLNYRERGETLRASSIVVTGPRPWLLELILGGRIVRFILPRGCLLITDRRLLLFRLNAAGSAIMRLERVEQLDQVRISAMSRGLLRPRLALSVTGQPGLQVTFPFAWRSRARAVEAALHPSTSSALV
jgi:hypothetical protein